jgi:transcriptional regulator with XRE-family HTH domain
VDARQIYIRNLRKIRRGVGLSQMKLAERCETSTNYIGCIEAGLKFPSIEMIDKIARALHLPVYQFFLENQRLAGRVKPVFARYLLPEAVKQDILNQLEAVARRVKKY